MGTKKTLRISVGSTVYPVVENIGYMPSNGRYAKRVRVGKDVHRVAISSSLRGPWRFWTADDVLQFLPSAPPSPSKFW